MAVEEGSDTRRPYVDIPKSGFRRVLLLAILSKILNRSQQPTVLQHASCRSSCRKKKSLNKRRDQRATLKGIDIDQKCVCDYEEQENVSAYGRDPKASDIPCVLGC
jgi:hypothetical protein